MLDLLILVCFLASFVAIVFIGVSLVVPSKGLFFAVSAKQTRLRGAGFWVFISTLLSLVAIGLISYQQGESLLGNMVVPAIMALAVFNMVRRLRTKGSWSDKDEGSETSDKYIVESFSEDDVEYTIDAHKLTCTCPDWNKRRSGFSRSSPERLCKHLTKYFSKNREELSDQFRPFAFFITESGEDDWGMRMSKDGLEIDYADIDGTGVLIQAKKSSLPWVDVYVKDTRYGYNYEEERWARREEPPKKGKIQERIHGMVG